MHKDEHLNDEEIVGLFEILRSADRRAALCDAVALTPWSEAEYRRCRAVPAIGEPIEDARRFLVRSWQGMAGSSVLHTSWISIDRATKRRPKIWRSLPERIGAVAERLQGVALHCRPAREIVARFARYPSAVLFIDPPYPSQAINSRDCCRVTMSDVEHEDFALQLREVDAAIIMTMAPDTIYDRVLADWHRLPLKVRGLRNSVKTETIFLNYDPARAGLFANV
jgi:DNA adenine methylase